MSHTTLRPGSMTKAMSAKTNSEPKVLRLGVVYNGRVVDERIIRERKTITAGSTERCTLSLRDGTVASPIELMVPHGDRFALVLHQGTELRFATALGPCTLESLRAQGRVLTVGDRELLPLEPTDRGKLSLGDVTFLFQFVSAPPVAPRAQLPESLKSSYVRNADWRYNSIVAGFLAVGLSGLGYVEYLYDPMVLSVDEIVSMVGRVHMELPSEPTANPEPRQPDVTPADNTVAEGAEGHEPSATERPTHHGATVPSASTVRDAQRDADRLMNALRHSNDAMFTTILAANGAGNGPASAHNRPDGLQENNADDLSHTTGITTNPSALHTGPVNTAFLPPGDLGHTRLHENTTVIYTVGPPDERRIVTRLIRAVPSEPTHDACETDASSVAHSFRTNLGGMRSCYERATRNDPNLAGRVSVSFTVGNSGRASAIRASGLTPELDSCLVGVVQRIVFPQSTCGGDAPSFTFPISFDTGAR